MTETAKPDASKPNRGGNKVTVACKVPTGLMLRIFNMEEHSEPVMGGGSKTVQKAVQIPQTVRLNGPAKPFGVESNVITVSGAALTFGVDAEFFRKWMEQNKDSDYVVNRIVFAHETEEHVRHQAKEEKAILSGLHPLVPDTDKRIPRQIKTATTASA